MAVGDTVITALFFYLYRYADAIVGAYIIGLALTAVSLWVNWGFWLLPATVLSPIRFCRHGGIFVCCLCSCAVRVALRLATENFRNPVHTKESHGIALRNSDTYLGRSLDEGDMGEEVRKG